MARIDRKKGSVRKLAQREAVRRAQALVRAYVPAGRSLSDELIADRRREAERDASALLALDG